MKEVATIHLNEHAPARLGRPAGVFGRQLESGDVLEENDVYNSTSGHWEKCPCPGLTLQEGVATLWIRPEAP